ncbi:MAG: hypothetical protein CMD20_00985 [Flavobacteriales bacterium]|jgi:hypothetical protein|nr:hypothetical protein [Flavobacteriales bacterium]
MAEFKLPTEQVDLPSKGLLYPKESPLSSGKVEIKYMTAKEEDILSNQSYIQKGIVLDKLLDELIINKDINHRDLVVGDKNAVLIAARILGYGKEYSFTWAGEEQVVDLTELQNNEFDPSNMINNRNEFAYTLPHSGNELTYRILTGREEAKITREIKGLKKINKDANPELTTRLKYMILSINGDEDNKQIREFVDNHLLARDSRAFRTHIRSFQPDVDLTITLDSGEEVEVPMGLSFFWPDI